ncbi:MAG: FAD-dependent oxidoreductase, partial [Candidatus Nanohaloarchaea archaeon]|nr:FAD-dependent oxidoreductase [Candidatus Nanohaloarchaea archaeon]
MDSEVAVAGCGIAGLETALRLERKGIEVAVVEPQDSTLFYPALHHLLAGRDVPEVSIDLEDKFQDREIHHVRERLTGMRPGENVMELEDGELEFDQAVIAVGSVTSYGSIEGEGNVHDLRFRDDTEEIQEKLEEGDVERVAVVGGGATGVEATASLHDASQELEEFTVTLLESSDRLLPQFPEKMGRKVEKIYRNRGIDV